VAREHAAWRWNLHGAELEGQIDRVLKDLFRDGIAEAGPPSGYDMFSPTLRANPWLLERIPAAVEAIREQIPDAELSLLFYGSRLSLWVAVRGDHRGFVVLEQWRG
jgi:hypothetical protein